MKETGSLTLPVSGGEPSESGGDTPFISESFLIFGRAPAQDRSRLNRFWKQFLFLILLVLLSGAFSKITFREYCLHHYFPLEFFHVLVISLLLGGRAPPHSA